jgi:nicotinamidase-related amidase
MKLSSKETSLLIIDMQKDFCYEKGVLYVPGAKKIIPNIKRLLEKAKAKKVSVVFTQDWHKPDDAEFAVWPRHCVEDTEGAEIIDELKTDAFVVKKRKYTAFFGTDLDSYLREHDIRSLIITGVVTNICVMHTASDAVLHGYGVIVPKDCVAALSEYDQEYALKHITFSFKGKIVDSDSIRFE